MEDAAYKRKSSKAQLILKTSEELFRKHGIKRVTVEEICQKASVSKMTFYKYYENKEELFKQIMNNILEFSIDKVKEVSRMDISIIEKIRILLKMKEEYLSGINDEFFSDYVNPTPELKSFLEDYYARGIKLFVDFIKEAQEKGEVRKEIKPEFLIAVLNKLVDLVQDPQLRNLYSSTIEFSLEINNFFYCGILPLDKVEQKSV